MNMKITVSFEANSMANLKDQLLEAFGSISVGGGDLVKCTNTENPHVENSFIGKVVDTLTNHTGLDVAAPNSDNTAVTKIDGQVVSVGKVWEPVQGSSNAFTGTPVEDYKPDLDSKGTAWNPEIHTSTKVKTQSGEWKKRPVRGGAVQATQPVVQASPVIPATPTTNEPVHMPFVKFPPIEEAQAEPVTESLKPAIGAAPDMHSYESFKKNLGLITVRLANQGKINGEYIAQLAAHFKVNQLWDIVSNEDNCRILYNHFIQHDLILGV